MHQVVIEEITVLPGKNRAGADENFKEIKIRPGDTISIVGPTGSGKSAFINDIEIFAQNDTVTGRRVLVNGDVPPEDFVRDPSKKPVAMITQNTKCLADLTVRDFILMHARSRKIDGENIIEKTIALANEFTGEEIRPVSRMTSLSGGQTRSLMIADAVVISDTPVILLDEVENAGIFKEKVMECLKLYKKAFLFVTHDPLISLLSKRRIVMKNGAVSDVICPGDSEKEALYEVLKMDSAMSALRERIRCGELIKSVPLP
ncbi:ABC-type lipoprotein export system ATPase subunit [Methanomicrobium sp. W14]|uniref:ATP-binding cassette domain-containing protein n=1 Tax=Methanomicrobium sp. W14 TaxID=2817839 RepID=UPI001AE88557|nr:ATP-binding cassette domain-containing protein [Methanomicrobium sp. W14]MBP2133541.1 ABC-type lipoprotein export system ATPase subunit [Methanomicrobium sp. W14]